LTVSFCPAASTTDQRVVTKTAGPEPAGVKDAVGVFNGETMPLQKAVVRRNNYAMLFRKRRGDFQNLVIIQQLFAQLWAGNILYLKIAVHDHDRRRDGGLAQDHEHRFQADHGISFLVSNVRNCRDAVREHCFSLIFIGESASPALVKCQAAILWRGYSVIR
jgi:hypothetical protein